MYGTMDFNCVNIEDYCRLCLDTGSQKISIFQEHIQVHIKLCVGITISHADQFPKFICKPCESLLHKFYNFQQTARSSQDWLKGYLAGKSKHVEEPKITFQPLPDSEYNSDSLLEFLNNTTNIDEYLINLSKDDLPSIVNILETKNTDMVSDGLNIGLKKSITPKKRDYAALTNQDTIAMEIDVLDSDIELVKEILSREPKKDNKLICFVCKSTFSDGHSLEEHKVGCEISQRTCHHCKAVFGTRLKMLMHSTDHINTFPASCICGKLFFDKEKMSKHYSICQMNSILGTTSLYRCRLCDKTFEDGFQLFRHVKNHVVREQSRVCDVCGHAFVGEESLKKHKRQEHKQLSGSIYRCKICKYTSSDHKQMYLHVKKHTKSTEKKHHLCETCGKSFSSRAALNKHSHGRIYKCSHCSRSFVEENEKELHILNEHTEKVMCEKCGLTVTSSHISTHVCT